MNQKQVPYFINIISGRSRKNIKGVGGGGGAAGLGWSQLQWRNLGENLHGGGARGRHRNDFFHHHIYYAQSKDKWGAMGEGGMVGGLHS